MQENTYSNQDTTQKNSELCAANGAEDNWYAQSQLRYNPHC